MTVPAVTPFCADPTPTPASFVGRIPVRNVWLLLLYASDLYRTMPPAERCAAEDNPDDIPDLIAEILAGHVERRLHRHPTQEFKTRFAISNRIRGRVDMLETERQQLLQRGKVACHYAELTVDTPRNCLVRAALEHMSKQAVKCRKLKQRCRTLAVTLERHGVIGQCPSPKHFVDECIGRGYADDRPMVAAAQFAFHLELPSEAVGSEHHAQVERDVVWARKLFERAVAGFYQVRLPASGWHISSQRNIDWMRERPTPRIHDILPAMRPDLILEHVSNNRRIILDTKFNEVLTRGWYRDEAIRSAYMYQIFAYVRSQEQCNDQLSHKAEGILLHPSAGVDVHESVYIQGHRFSFCTVDLASCAEKIQAQLLRVVCGSEAPLA